ncbi:cell adhesion molecule 2 isoform X2 [Lingula anatina]|uniref:Cell adhesion molecule 2 isoform X2 n=1 Tax=Lingula anatina TaxID=7574 RepID=A0A1S3HHS6_LINAN|nr:cell adhesion molecule 2 isoform X2 [Lingula anatina]|eukprot:XP_013384544.1 cell adhesion molecule 2 isoform X2 [Lingula anatina]
MKGFLVAICILCCYSTRLATGLEVTLAGLPVNGYVMNPEGGNPQPLNLVCSYTVDPGETAQYVIFYKDGTDIANQIVVIQVSDGTHRKFNSYLTRADVTATASDPSYTLTIGGVTMADEGSYRCRVSTEFNTAIVTTDEQILNLLYRPNPPQITRGPEVATGTFRVSCSSDGGRPAPEIKWFKMQSSDQIEVAINASANRETPQGDTILVESEVEVMATEADPVQVFCQLLHDSLTSQSKTNIIIPESAAPSTTTTVKPTNTTDENNPGTKPSTGALGGGAVAGIVIAVLIIVAIIVGVVVFLVRRRSAEPKQPKEEQTGAENPAASQTDQRDEKPPIEEYKPEPTTV